MKTFRFLSLVSFIAILILGFTSCKKESGKSRLSVYLTDAPADYDALNIEITGLQIKASADNGEGGWQSLTLPSTPVSYNLLDFTNGMDVLLSSVELPAGKVSQMRLILSNNNSIVINGATELLPLDIPSGQQSGLKFNIHADLLEGVEYKIWIDFDAARSVVETGSGGHILKPVLRTFTEATSGAIKGIVLPTAADATVYASMGTDTLGAIPDAASGEYLIRGVPAGTWKVDIKGNNGYNDQAIENVSVSIGQATDVGTTTLNQ